MFAGAYRGPTLNYKSPMTDALSPAFDVALSPANGGDVLEHETIAAILSYRHYLRDAQSQFERMGQMSNLQNAGQLRRAITAYRSALEKLDDHERRLSLLLSELGYVPKCDGEKFH